MITLSNTQPSCFSPENQPYLICAKPILEDKCNSGWFSSKESQQIQNYIKPKDVKVDMKMNVLKSLQAKLITFLFDRIKSCSGTITIG